MSPDWPQALSDALADLPIEKRVEILLIVNRLLDRAEGELEALRRDREAALRFTVDNLSEDALTRLARAVEREFPADPEVPSGH